jgi:hypothetical protein
MARTSSAQRWEEVASATGRIGGSLGPCRALRGRQGCTTKTWNRPSSIVGAAPGLAPGFLFIR